MKIILVGYRASGKTSAGRLLSLILKVPFYDTDHVIEEKTGKPVKNIITHRGWDYFRERETDALRTLIGKKNCVVATGGGIVLKKENVDLIKKMGKVIWLDAPLHDIIDRLNEDAQSGKSRPQFTDGDIEKETADVLKERTTLYKHTADFTVKTEGKSAAQVAEEIYKLVRK